MNISNRIAITTGDFNGIGAEITIKALNELNMSKEDIILISNSDIINKYGSLNTKYDIIEIPYNGEITPGGISKEAGEFSFLSLKKACEIKPKAIVTAPVAKEALHLANHNFSGQTEILEYFLGNKIEKAEMLFISDAFDVFLLTRHLPLLSINITEDLIISKITRLAKFYGKNTKFALCALNPHAGENGILGNEENDIIIPAINKLRDSGINITNPMPADTLFVEPIQAYLKGNKPKYDCYIAMYHDQGLIPLKAVAIDDTVNTTIGLPILRTSPAHGTAFDIAGKNIANHKSMVSAICTSIKYQDRVF